MAKRCKRNGDLSERITPISIHSDDQGYYIHVCMHPGKCHRGSLEDLRYVEKRCVKPGKRPCIHYRLFRDVTSLRTSVSVQAVEVKVDYPVS